ncbi:hypothetical protein DFH09DRAFT_1069435 [Mycena vulgaris]|nr:hypothetical protein DFH09DRAFT_1069435 [Mycena vulgaris]
MLDGFRSENNPESENGESVKNWLRYREFFENVREQESLIRAFGTAIGLIDKIIPRGNLVVKGGVFPGRLRSGLDPGMIDGFQIEWHMWAQRALHRDPIPYVAGFAHISGPKRVPDATCATLRVFHNLLPSNMPRNVSGAKEWRFEGHKKQLERARR